MKRRGNFFSSHFSGENKKWGQLTFYSIFSCGGNLGGEGGEGESMVAAMLRCDLYIKV